MHIKNEEHKSHKKRSVVLTIVTSVYVGLLISVFLLAIPAGGYMVIDAFKYTLFLLICGGYCVVVAVIRFQFAAAGVRPINLREGIREIPLVMWLLFLYLGFTIFSAIFSGYGGVFFGGFRQEGVLTVAIYVFTCFFLSKYFVLQKWMLPLLGVSVILFCALSFVQLTGANPFMLFPEGFNYYDAGIYYSGEFLGTIGNAGLGGAFLSIVAGIFAVAVVRGRYLFCIPLFFAVWLIFAMRINAAIFALVVGFVIMLPVLVKCRESLARTLIVLAVMISAFALSQAVVFGNGITAFYFSRLTPLIASVIVSLLTVLVKNVIVFDKIPIKWCRLGALLFTLFIVLFAVLYLLFFGDNHDGMIFEASQMLRGYWDDSFGTSRIFIWRSVLDRLTLWGFLFGTGPDTLGHWDIPPFTRFSEELGINLTVHIDDAHNKYLHMLATRGIFTLLSYLSAIVLILVKWIRSSDNHVIMITGAGIVFYCIQAFFGITSLITASFFWACVGICICTINSREVFNEEED